MIKTRPVIKIGGHYYRRKVIWVKIKKSEKGQDNMELWMICLISWWAGWSVAWIGVYIWTKIGNSKLKYEGQHAIKRSSKT